MKNMVLVYIVATMMLNSACTYNRNSNHEFKHNEKTLTGAIDTLKFTSGIRSMLQDSRGNYWFGSDQEGVCKFDGTTFKYYTPENGFCGKQVIYIQEDDTGLIWFGTSSGLCSFDGKKFTAVAGREVSASNHSVDKKFPSLEIKATDLWFPGNNIYELIRIDHGISSTIQYPFKMRSKGNPGDYGVTGFSKSKNGGLWIAYYSGVAYYDGKNIQYIHDSTMHYDGKSKYMHVRSILEDSKGRLWIGNNGIGVQFKEKDTIVHFSEKHGLVRGDIFAYPGVPGTLMHVFAITEDSKGHIWFGDRDTGAWVFDGKEIKNYVLNTSLKTQHIWDIYEDKSGNLLFASGDRGVYQFNGNGFDRVF